MFGKLQSRTRLLLALFFITTLPACISVQAIEPVITPPTFYQGDVTVPVEFVAPPMVGVRCAERGAKFLGLPGLNSGACADPDLITMQDPCMTFTGGAFAAALCKQYQAALESADADQSAAATSAPTGAALANAAWIPGTDAGQLVKAGFSPRTDSSPMSQRPEARIVQIEFAAPGGIEYRCAERGAKFVDDRGSGVIACADRDLVTISNPCDLKGGGWYARTLCHEMAHANGWPANHTRKPPPPRASESAEAVRWRQLQVLRAGAGSGARTEAKAAEAATPPPVPAVAEDLPVSEPAAERTGEQAGTLQLHADLARAVTAEANARAPEPAPSGNVLAHAKDTGTRPQRRPPPPPQPAITLPAFAAGYRTTLFGAYPMMLAP